jgi:hypothetical protein
MFLASFWNGEIFYRVIGITGAAGCLLPLKNKYGINYVNFFARSKKDKFEISHLQENTGLKLFFVLILSVEK